MKKTRDAGPTGTRKLKIGNVEVPNNVFLAPMSGVSDLPFRRLANKFGAGLVVSEMVASQELTHDHDESVLRSAGEGLDVHVVQLAGREAKWMGEAAKIARANGADIVDINMGCPAKKVTSGYSGSALMRDLDHALTLIEATVAAVDCPVTLKMRLGWDERTINAPELARRAEAAGVQMITVHGRTRSQFYKGRADWSAIKAVKEEVSVPLVANGDISSFVNAKDALQKSGADAVMVGRGSYAQPWLPGHIAMALQSGAMPQSLTIAEKHETFAAHYEGLIAHYGDHIGKLTARKHIGWLLDRLSASGEQKIPAQRRMDLIKENDPAVVIAKVGALLSEFEWSEKPLLKEAA